MNFYNDLSTRFSVFYIHMSRLNHRSCLDIHCHLDPELTSTPVNNVYLNQCGHLDPHNSKLSTFNDYLDLFVVGTNRFS